MKRCLVLLLVACGKTTPAPPPDAAPPDAAPPDAAPPDAASPVSLPDAASADAQVAPAPVHLSMITRPGSDFDTLCLVVDDAGHTIGHATSRRTAAGGSTVECDHFDAEGKVVVLKNSRGVYSKDGRPGPKNDQRLPCDDGVFANDVSSCVQFDESPFAYTPDEPKAEDISIKMVDLATKKEVVLAKIPHGLGRRPYSTRDWSAAYCSNSRVVVVANGQLSLFEAPSGKRIAQVPAKGATRVDCNDAAITINRPSRRFRVDDTTLTSLED